MSYEHVWAVIGILAICAGAAISVWARHLREAKRVAVREMIHRERLAALEKGQPMPEIPAEPGAADAGDPSAWIGRAALLVGLALLFAGIGFAAAFGFTPDTPETRGMQDLAAMGLLPALTGVGVLLFYLLDRRNRRPPGA